MTPSASWHSSCRCTRTTNGGGRNSRQGWRQKSPPFRPRLVLTRLRSFMSGWRPMARQHRLQGITGRFLWVRRCGCLGFAVADGKAPISGSASASLSGGCWGSGSEGGSRGNPAFVGSLCFVIALHNPTRYKIIPASSAYSRMVSILIP